MYLSGEMSKPKRLQSAFITEDEIKKVVKHIVNAYKERLPDGVDITSKENDTDVIFTSAVDEEDGDEDTADDDGLYEEAREIVIQMQKASTSYLQRKFRIGYSRAANIIDVMEERGVVGPANGSKARDVLIKPHEEEGEIPEDE